MALRKLSANRTIQHLTDAQPLVVTWKSFGSTLKVMFKKVTHVIFDMDGLLLDTEGVYDTVIQSIASRYGKEYSLEIRMKVKGTPEPESAKIAVREMALPITPAEFLRIYTPACEDVLKHPKLMPGAEKLIRHLHKHNIPIAIATSGSETITKIKTLDFKDLFAVFHHSVYGSSDPEVKNGKPNPDIYLVCASRFPDKPKPEQCLVLEDAPNGVTGALRAGMQVVMVPAEDVSEELRKPATICLKSLTEFQPQLFGLPPY